ncbi:PDR/VanB family oxidoreductase [Mycolicibacterium baixiangningiae]|uniref:PDR/VanB family oxidoreductase n=1 Tax=Mycolicibacterium baixiangningiae TaxID=2761578 RepID=UPI0018676C9C|nr:PDR/VanB family oxidoreductase [Mycolicibacterium baixiangningiae]
MTGSDAAAPVLSEVDSDTFTLEVTARRLVGCDIVVLELASPDGTALPPWQPGAHLEVNLPAVDGDVMLRQYSLCGDPLQADVYRIAVLALADGRGGSSYILDNVHPGTTVRVRGPRNHFPLEDAPSYAFVAGGIGITPILAMARATAAAGKPWKAVYLARDSQRLAFGDELMALGPDATMWTDEEHGRFDLAGFVDDLPAGTHLYACGPGPMLDALEALHSPDSTWQLHLERFAAITVDTSCDVPFEVVVKSSGTSLTVPPDCSILSVLRKHGIQMEYSCSEGVCGTCETDVLEGIPDHRDAVLSPEEQEANETMMVCVSRARTPRLVLDI